MNDLGELTKEEALKSYRRYMLRLEERIYQEELLKSQGKEVELPYLSPSIYSLYDMLIRYDQFQDVVIPEGDHYKKSTQVIKVMRMIPREVLDNLAPERVVSAGLFIVTTVYFLDGELVRLAEGTGKGRGFKSGPTVGPESHGLPSQDLVNYGTIKRISGDVYIALAATTWLSDYIYNTYQYDYPTLCLKGVDHVLCEYEYAESGGSSSNDKSDKNI